MENLITTTLTLLIDTSYSWIRMFLALGLSIVISLFVGIYAARSKRAEKIIMPLVDILQTLPILAFFPFAIYLVILFVPGAVGVNVAVIGLIVTSMIWNIIFGVYESIKTIPKAVLEVADLYRLGILSKLRKIFIPAAMPRVIGQSILSWSIGLFYLVTSEIFSTGSTNYTVSGIGVDLTRLAFSDNYYGYIIGIVIFFCFVIITRFAFFSPLEKYFNRTQKQYVSTEDDHTKFISGGNVKSSAGAFVKYIKSNLRSFGLSNMRSWINSIYAAVKEYRRILAISLLVVLSLIGFLYALNILNGTLASYEYQSLYALAYSFIRVWGTFFAIFLISVPVSIYLIFLTKNIGRYVLLFQILASIPATILLPIIVRSTMSMPFHSEIVAFVVLFLSGIWYMIFSVIASHGSIPSETNEVKNIFGVRGLLAFKKIYLKAITPGLITGAVTAIAAEWNATIVAEYFTSSGIQNGTVLSSVNIGVGKLLDLTLNSGNLLQMLIVLINFVILIVVINRLVWNKLYNKVETVYG